MQYKPVRQYQGVLLLAVVYVDTDLTRGFWKLDIGQFAGVIRLTPVTKQSIAFS